MKVLLVHNYYGSEAPSGENVVFEAEKALLEQYGHTVRVFTRHSDEIRSQGAFGAVRGAAAVAWNRLPLPPCASWLMIFSLMWFMHTIPFR